MTIPCTYCFSLLLLQDDSAAGAGPTSPMTPAVTPCVMSTSVTCSKRSGVALNTRGLTTDTQNTKNLQLREDPSGLVLIKATPAGINTAMRGDIQRKPATQGGEEKVAGQRGKRKWEEEPQV